jgi:hypothetical protein
LKKRGRKPSKYKTKFWEQLPQATQKPIGSILEDIDTTVKEGFKAIGRNDGSEVQIISEAVAKLPAYMKGLGYYLAEAEHEASIAKDDYEMAKTRIEKELIDEGKPVGVAERSAAVSPEVVKAKEVMRTAQHNFRVLKLQNESTDRQVRGFTSRLATVRGEVVSGV